ncbi:exodeoxyribonuclease V subunit beta [Candidatus Francisella endociliophora]|uniref:RecBCD enzyme subunit RecB n=1 Tax=Candidatus Francisella endociliophora TaxID=653937 RepID=A0A097ER55_9GAMM|nr:exodeoxyribonuclease V subunit beta [Francisella sp. FSC1006]AIT10061.1 exodeoxyribonuclease V subunit beta [Francisella sp. FSC1006]
MKNLDAKTISLQGRHIIEASAGTGKTYNITELYIRLLLEKKLLPSNILVMTFTKDATQEIIGRVEAKIRDVLNSYTEEKKESNKENYKHLKRALLEIDEAAIFTIHGFCKKVLSEQAFASGMEMDVSMEVDTSDILQKVVEDFFRKNINKSETNFEYLKAYSLHTPEKFLDKLRNVVRANYEILADTFEQEIEKLAKEKQQVFVNLEVNKSFIFDNLILAKDKKKASIDKEQARIIEWQVIESWFNDSQFSLIPKEVSAFINGNRYRGREDIAEVFEEIKDLKDKYLKIKDLDEYKKQFDAAQFIKQSCLKISEDFTKAKEQKGVLDFDDLISKLCQSVKKSPDLVKTLQQQYPVALIDEFQDTDAQQYEILDTVYPMNRDDLLLLMIGDPKQAIYGFRGGDIFTYLKAKASCPNDNQWSMDTNWRSTSQMIKAYNRLFYKEDYNPGAETKVGDNIFSEGIGYQIVKASPKADEKIKDFGDNLKPINYFYYAVKEEDKKGDIDTQLSTWTANEISRLLNSGKVAENDIAILVENRTQATSVQQALAKNNLSSVYLSQRDNVYHSQEASEILTVMEGINELENKSLLKRALSTSLLGGTAEKFIEYTDENDISAWDNEIEKAKSLRKQWQKYGFMSFIMAVLHDRFTQRGESKERTITNILHLAELIKVAENKYKHPNQLIKWYRQQIKVAATAEGELRLESDDNLIKIITIHGSKGLEYPVVFVPFASSFNSKKIQTQKINKYYDSKLGQIVYKIGECDIAKNLIEKETVEELMRLLYVAVTRAEHRCYIGGSKYKGCENSPLAQFLKYKKDDDWLDKVQKITANPVNQSMFIDISSCHKPSKQRSLSTSTPLSNHVVEVPCYDELKSKNITLKNDNWEMLSFSKISKSKSQNIALEKENDESEDENVQELKQSLEYRFTAPKGADLGNILHNALEHTDFSTGPIEETLLQEQIDRYKVVAAEDFENIKRWLEECLEAPIKKISQSRTEKCPQTDLFLDNGSLDNSFCLKDIPNTKTLKEAEFYFPITNKKLFKTNIISFLENYRNLPVNYSEFDNQKVFGMLHGFIDLIFEYDGKYYVADYKSNYLGDKLENYNQQSMQEKNRSSFYDLQYLIYSVALDKYLQQNIADYDFEQHFGGVYYFYLRGMKNGFGVYSARPSLEIISKLSKLFDGGKANV